ncbi:hypothetical protein [Sinorhizobium mexicanum]|uniref:Uncharacterized protein n=1 Tax=Sinorhizobium mexicanum TaxID=375549 RepID=A0A859QMR8_9HYPH|nr:hypothetical protein [Sinorhizobium mexicanum]MBP1881813.1 hypothetical protein [Sinorhizobium mexicanum]QLL61566.1 hypothetical protein FKV68_08945 [Sinorhizobium mexicanum]
MIDAASAYCLSTHTSDRLDPPDYEAIFHESVTDRDSRSYWEAAASVLNDVFHRDGEIHASQLRYVARVYPERVTVEEADDVWTTVLPETRQAWSDAALSATALVRGGYRHSVGALADSMRL